MTYDVVSWNVVMSIDVMNVMSFALSYVMSVKSKFRCYVPFMTHVSISNSSIICTK
jgi:hypothetical protein